MKNILIFLSLIALCAFGYDHKAASTYKADRVTAEVNRMDGLYVFTDCNPVLQYETIGVVKMGLRSLGKGYADTKSEIIRTVKDRYIIAEAVIIKDEESVVIRFTEGTPPKPEPKEKD